MSDFFDDSHVTEVGLEGSAGPAVSVWDMVQQGFRQQYRVDSARALDEELRNRWLESLRAAQIDEGEVADPYDPYAYRAFAQHVRGQPIDVFDPNRQLFGEYDPTARIRGMIDANEQIRQLNNPEIRTFEQILEEVSQMQRGVEMETGAMSERGGTLGIVGELIGAIGGSFTIRDPLNVITAPIGAGRTIATRIATDMAVAAGVVTATEFGDVAPNRALAGLPERNPLFNIAAATIGAGIIRGGIEGVGYGVRRARERLAGEEVDFDLRDSQLQQMFGENPTSPTARAGAQALDDTIFIERNNPYGEGQAANARFLAELQEVQRVMGGEPMTAVARVLPPVPFEYIQKAADFEIVREQAPLVYARMEQAQARLADLTRQANEVASQVETIDASILSPRFTDAKGALDIGAAGTELRQRVDRAISEGAEVTLFVEEKPRRITGTRTLGLVDEQDQPWGAAAILMPARGDPARVEIRPQQATIVSTPALRRAANAEYQTAYRAVEAEAVRFREAQTRVEAAQQREATHIFADATQGRSFNWSALQHDHVQSRVDAINAFNDTLDEKAVAAFVRAGDGEAVAREAWLTEDGRVDIGLKEPIDPDFRIATDDGEMSVADAMRDLQDDADLDDAMRTCLL